MLHETPFADDLATATGLRAPACAPRTSSPDRPAQQCPTCSMRSACVPHALGAQDLTRFDSIVSATRLIKRGDSLYRANDPFQSIYAIRAGSFKTVVMHRDGREQDGCQQSCGFHDFCTPCFQRMTPIVSRNTAMLSAMKRLSAGP